MWMKLFIVFLETVTVWTSELCLLLQQLSACKVWLAFFQYSLHHEVPVYKWFESIWGTRVTTSDNSLVYEHFLCFIQWRRSSVRSLLLICGRIGSAWMSGSFGILKATKQFQSLWRLVDAERKRDLIQSGSFNCQKYSNKIHINLTPGKRVK